MPAEVPISRSDGERLIRLCAHVEALLMDDTVAEEVRRVLAKSWNERGSLADPRREVRELNARLRLALGEIPPQPNP